jgi:hypothetical protein
MNSGRTFQFWNEFNSRPDTIKALWKFEGILPTESVYFDMIGKLSEGISYFPVFFR